MRWRGVWMWASVWCVFVLLCGCKDGGLGVSSRRVLVAGRVPYVVATTGMLADAVRRVGGRYVRVDGLMGPGVDPHMYKVTLSDTGRLLESDLVIYNGLHLEGKMQEVLKKMSRYRLVVAGASGIPRERLRRPLGFHGLYDPHIWFDVALWRYVVRRISRSLQYIAPVYKRFYQANAAAYDRELAALDAWARRSIAKIPKAQRVLVTAHDAFGYFGRAYGLEVVGLQGVSTVAEAGVKDVERVIGLLVSRKIPAIFVETSVSERMSHAVLQGCLARGHQVKIGGSLFSDAMGAKGTPGGTYVGMVSENVRTIVSALTKRPHGPFVWRKGPTSRRFGVTTREMQR